MSCGELLLGLNLVGDPSSLYLDIAVSPQIWENFSHYLLKYVCRVFSLCLLLLNFYYMKVSSLNGVSWLPWALFIFFILFSFCYSSWIISDVLFFSSLIVSSIWSLCCWRFLWKIFHLVIVFFISRFSIFCYISLLDSFFMYWVFQISFSFLLIFFGVPWTLKGLF